MNAVRIFKMIEIEAKREASIKRGKRRKKRNKAKKKENEHKILESALNKT